MGVLKRKKKLKKIPRKGPIIENLEPRILLSADLLGIDVATTDLPDDGLDPGDATDPIWPVAEAVSTDPASIDSVAPEARREILFVDTSIDDFCFSELFAILSVPSIIDS